MLTVLSYRTEETCCSSPLPAHLHIHSPLPRPFTISLFVPALLHFTFFHHLIIHIKLFAGSSPHILFIISLSLFHSSQTFFPSSLFLDPSFFLPSTQLFFVYFFLAPRHCSSSALSFHTSLISLTSAHSSSFMASYTFHSTLACLFLTSFNSPFFLPSVRLPFLLCLHFP